MTFHIHGDASQRVLICLHGFMGDGGDWDGFADAFSTRMPGWQVVVPTLPGHDAASHDDWDVFGAIVHWMDSRGLAQAVIAGYSLGGRLGLRLALDDPQRFPVLVGISTTAGIGDAIEREARRVADHGLAERLRSCADRESFQAFLEEWWAQPVFSSPYPRESQRQAFLESRHNKSSVRLAEALERWSPGVLPSEWERLAGYPGKVLLLSGEADAKFTLISNRMQELFRDAQAHQLIAAGHQLLVERPAEVAAIVAEFLYEEQPQAAQ